MGTLVSDPFTEASNTVLESHTPNTAGTGWTQETAGSSDNPRVSGANDYVEVTSGGASDHWLYSAQPDPSSADQNISVLMTGVDGSADDTFWLIGRMADTSNLYGAGGSGNSAVNLIYKTVSGTDTEIATVGSQTWSGGDTLELELRTNSQDLILNSSSILTASDTALTSAGKCGMAMGNIFRSADDQTSPWKIDDFLSTEVAAAPFLPYYDKRPNVLLRM